jgi:PAS domain S-box-containing protein
MRRATPRQTAGRYGLALLFSAAAIGARFLMGDTTSLVFVTFYPAVMAAAWFGGVGPALASVALCGVVGDFLFAQPQYRLLAETLRGWTNLVLFVTVGAAIGIVTGRLRQVQSRFRSVLELTSDGFAIVDRDWTLAYANPRLATMVERRADEIVGRPVWNVFAEGGDFPFGGVARRAMDGERGEFVAHHAALGRWFEASVYPLPEGIAILARDVSATKELEVRRAEQLTRLETANRMKDEFLATLSHELRTPLNAVLGWAQLVRNGATTVERGLDAVDRNATLLKQLVDDLLDTSSIVSGKLQVRLESMDFTTVVLDAVDAARAAAQSRHIAVAATGLDRPMPVLGDAARLRQAVLNLLANAIKFTPERGQVVVDLAAAAGHAVLRIRDTGVGIDPRLLPRVFERFVQGDRPATVPQGLGLGLAIAKHVVDVHGGRITAQSDGLMRGALFTIALPLSGRAGDAGVAAHAAAGRT